MRMLPILCLLISVGLSLFVRAAEMRTWTASDGRQIEASLVSATAESFIIRRANGATFKLNPDQVSEEDRAFVEKFLADEAQPESESTDWKEGPYAKSCDGDWQKMEAESGLKFHFFAEKRALKTGKLYPLCIYLHGASNTGSNLTKREPGANMFANEDFYDDRPCIVIAPEAPAGTGSFGKISDNIFSLVEHLASNLPIDRTRIYITGYSMGSRGCWDLMIAAPDIFAAAVPVGGPLAKDKASKVPKIPIWVHYGEMDRKDEFEGLLAALKESGNEVKSTEHAGANHNSFHNKVAKDEEMYEWMFSQKR